MNDLIKRQDAIEAVKRTKPIVRSSVRNWGKMIAEEHSKELIKALNDLPSAGGVVRFCDVIDDCEDCPKYGRSCDGDKR